MSLASSQETFAESTIEWEPIPLAEAGFSPDVGDKLDAAFHRDKLPNLHGVLVVRHAKLALERYYDGPDERRGCGSCGYVQFGPEVIHDRRSVS